MDLVEEVMYSSIVFLRYNPGVSCGHRRAMLMQPFWHTLPGMLWKGCCCPKVEALSEVRIGIALSLAQRRRGCAPAEQVAYHRVMLKQISKGIEHIRLQLETLYDYMTKRTKLGKSFIKINIIVFVQNNL